MWQAYDELLNEHGLADTGTTEETNLTTTGVWGAQVDDLDTSDEHLSAGGLVHELWGFLVNWKLLLVLDGATLINWVTSDVDDTAKSTWADWNHDGRSRVGSGLSTDETLSSVHSNASHDVLTQMLLPPR